MTSFYQTSERCTYFQIGFLNQISHSTVTVLNKLQQLLLRKRLYLSHYSHIILYVYCGMSKLIFCDLILQVRAQISGNKVITIIHSAKVHFESIKVVLRWKDLHKRCF